MSHLWPLILAACLYIGSTAAWQFTPPARRWRAWYRSLRDRGDQRSGRCPTRVKRRVMRADRYRCVYCHSTWMLQADHIIPWAWGGLATVWNMAALCGACNRIKSSYFEDGGRVHYRAFRDAGNISTAAAILAVERRNRLNPARWIRAWL